MKKLLLSIILIISLLSITACTGNESGQETSEQITNPVTEQDVQEFTRETAKNLMEAYRQSLVSLFTEAGKDQKITSYQSKQDINEHFREVMSDDLALWMTDAYFEEKADGLYVIAKDSPTWLDKEKDFTIEKISDTHYTINQERNNELLGHVMMVYHAVYEDKKWIVNEIETNDMEIRTNEQAEQFIRESLNIESNYQVDFDHMVNDQFLIQVYEIIDEGKATEHTATKGWYLLHPETKEITNYMTSETTAESKEVSIKDIAKTTLELIAAKDFKELANYIHPEKGVLFSPYVYITDDALVFNKNEITTFSQNDKVYTWGAFDGSGKPIELTPGEYYDQFLYKNDFLKADEIVVNEVKQRGNTINNIKDRFPNAHVVEFHLQGSNEYAGMDWSSINLVFEKNQDGVWKVVALVNDMWTI